ncbi:uncharacterized protein LOC132758182 [Ruditapes philippinarum]|uniref:uncharacterized protein LOC132758182 n=1 Tax=Ruditapes philippinarum TaxID=129788 RepID=UPI00295B9AC9|nr:uncharacterized protein LOC132758182 [Ruditapes philippinarum]
MTLKIILWIYILPICRVQSANGYDVTSPGAIIGIVLVAIVIITAIVIIVVICLKKTWHKQRRQNTISNKTKKVPKKPTTISETLIEKLPDIPEVDENISASGVSVRDESKLTFYQIDNEASTTEAGDIDKENEKVEQYEANKISEDMTVSVKTDKIQTQTEESETFESKPDEPKSSGEDLVKTINCESETTQDIKSEVSITRVIENENILRKDLPYLNSTEHIFSEYDPAMTYKSESEWKSKSDEGLHLQSIRFERKNIAPRAFEITRDDSDLNLKSQSTIEVEMHEATKVSSRSEGTLTDDMKIKSLKRRSSLISKVTSKSFQWNFDYISPYAMTDKQKRERYELKLKIRKRRMLALKQKLADKERQQYENKLAFEKWKLRKQGEKHYEGDIGSFNKRKFNKYNYWYP